MTNEQNSRKRNIAATALAIILALTLMITGTLASTDTGSSTAPTVTFSMSNTVGSSQSTNEDGSVTVEFELIPGTSTANDLAVSVTYTTDSYVFLLVDDNTIYNSVSYVDYTPGDSWTQLYAQDNESNPYKGEGYAVYYTQAKTSDSTSTNTDRTYTGSFQVLSGNTLTYSSSLTNEQMSALGENKVVLAFKAVIIEQNSFQDASAALNGYKNGSTE